MYEGFPFSVVLLSTVLVVIPSNDMIATGLPCADDERGAMRPAEQDEERARARDEAREA